MRYTPRNVSLAFNHAGLTHYGGAFFLHEFARVLQIRHFLSRHLDWERRNSRYTLSQMVLALAWPIILGLDRIETASLLRRNGTFQFLTGLQSFPDPQTPRRFLLRAPVSFATQLRRVNDRLLQFLIHLPSHRSRLILDLDSTVVTTFGHQEGATVGYNPRYRGKRSYQPLLCVEAGSAHLLAASLRPGKTDPHSGTVELFQECWSNLPSEVREIRVRADAGFWDNAFLSELEDRETQYAVVAQLRPPLRHLLPGLKYQRVNADWEIAECEYEFPVWSEPRRHVIARRLIETAEHHLTLFQLGRYYYRGWVTNMNLTPQGVWHYYDGRATIEVRIRELRDDFAFANIPTRAFAANNLYLEIIRFAYNLVTAFQRICLPPSWQSFTLRTLRHKLFLLPASLVRPHNRPVLRLHKTPDIEPLAHHILTEIAKIPALP
jgi:GNAT superfamily N-acetyltransferase